MPQQTAHLYDCWPKPFFTVGEFPAEILVRCHLQLRAGIRIFSSAGIACRVVGRFRVALDVEENGTGQDILRVSLAFPSCFLS